MAKRRKPRQAPAQPAEIQIETFNPYEGLFPGRKVISHENLLIVKALRAQGVTVVFLPRDERPVQYLFRKGFVQTVLDPVFAFVANSGGDIATGLISTAIWEAGKFAMKKYGQSIRPRLLVFRNGSKRVLTPGGIPTDPKWAEGLRDEMTETQQAFSLSRRTGSPFPNKPHPIHVEHTAQIVGWGLIGMDGGSLAVRDATITDDATLARLDRGELRGFSVSGIAEKTTCSVCQSDYVACVHVAGKSYEGIECVSRLEEMVLAEVSLVQEPVNPNCVAEVKRLAHASRAS